MYRPTVLMVSDPCVILGHKSWTSELRFRALSDSWTPGGEACVCLLPDCVILGKSLHLSVSVSPSGKQNRSSSHLGVARAQ
jgi:hypothetical protein